MTTTLLEREQTKEPVVKKQYDKRYFPRWDVNKRVEYIEEGGDVFRSYTKDLTLGGASVIVFGNPPARHYVKLRIHLADKENFEAQGRIAWRKSEPTCILLGIVFENLSQKAQELITGHAFELKEDHLLVYRLIKSLILTRQVSSKESFRPHHARRPADM